ncbi:MAG: hypothetical protein ABI573_11765 [Chloroflexota bacterium]
MDPRDPLRALPDGLFCTVCNEPVPADRIRLLARREDLTFIQVECALCGSTALEFLADPLAVEADAMPGEVTSVPAAISPDDVFAMHEFLADWQGDMRTLIGRSGGPAAPTEPGPRS